MSGGLLHPLFTLTPESGAVFFLLHSLWQEAYAATPGLEQKLSPGTLSFDVRTFLRQSSKTDGDCTLWFQLRCRYKKNRKVVKIVSLVGFAGG